MNFRKKFLKVLKLFKMFFVRQRYICPSIVVFLFRFLCMFYLYLYFGTTNV